MKKKTNIHPSRLMQNDWIRLMDYESGYQVSEVLGYNSPSEIPAIRVPMYQDEYYEDEIGGIPITIAFLVKNGFVKQTQLQSSSDGTKTKNKTRSSYVLILHPDTPQVSFISVTLRGNTTIKYHDYRGQWIKGINLPLTFVHELQQALRLCGFNELADNLKV